MVLPPVCMKVYIIYNGQPPKKHGCINHYHWIVAGFINKIMIRYNSLHIVLHGITTVYNVSSIVWSQNTRKCDERRCVWTWPSHLIYVKRTLLRSKLQPLDGRFLFQCITASAKMTPLPPLNISMTDSTVEPVLKDHPIGRKIMVSQDRCSLGTSSFTLKYSNFLTKTSLSGLWRQVVSHGSGLSRQVSLYSFSIMLPTCRCKVQAHKNNSVHVLADNDMPEANPIRLAYNPHVPLSLPGHNTLPLPRGSLNGENDWSES